VLQQVVPAIDGLGVLAVANGLLVSLLTELLVEFSFISAGHPAAVVLMTCGASDFLSTLLSLGLRGVQTLAMG
jgi:hypothetical protein